MTVYVFAISDPSTGDNSAFPDNAGDIQITMEGYMGHKSIGFQHTTSRSLWIGRPNEEQSTITVKAGYYYRPPLALESVPYAQIVVDETSLESSNFAEELTEFINKVLNITVFRSQLREIEKRIDYHLTSA
jgi:hypothetical protein